jgi:hypothetical protein
MKQMLKDAQRILDDCRENPLHPANNMRHPLHYQALKAITELEDKIFELVDKDRPLKKVQK